MLPSGTRTTRPVKFSARLASSRKAKATKIQRNLSMQDLPRNRVKTIRKEIDRIFIFPKALMNMYKKTRKLAASLTFLVAVLFSYMPAQAQTQKETGQLALHLSKSHKALAKSSMTLYWMSLEKTDPHLTCIRDGVSHALTHFNYLEELAYIDSVMVSPFDRQLTKISLLNKAERVLDYGITLSLLKECLTEITTPSHKLEGRHALILIEEIHHEIKRLLFDKKTDSSLK